MLKERSQFVLFGRDVGATVFVWPVHLPAHLHEKSWRCVDRANQRAFFWGRVRCRVKKGET